MMISAKKLNNIRACGSGIDRFVKWAGSGEYPIDTVLIRHDNASDLMWLMYESRLFNWTNSDVLWVAKGFADLVIRAGNKLTTKQPLCKYTGDAVDAQMFGPEFSVLCSSEIAPGNNGLAMEIMDGLWDRILVLSEMEFVAPGAHRLVFLMNDCMNIFLSVMCSRQVDVHNLRMLTMNFLMLRNPANPRHPLTRIDNETRRLMLALYYRYVKSDDTHKYDIDYVVSTDGFIKRINQKIMYNGDD